MLNLKEALAFNNACYSHLPLLGWAYYDLPGLVNVFLTDKKDTELERPIILLMHDASLTPLVERMLVENPHFVKTIGPPEGISGHSGYVFKTPDRWTEFYDKDQSNDLSAYCDEELRTLMSTMYPAFDFAFKLAWQRLDTARECINILSTSPLLVTSAKTPPEDMVTPYLLDESILIIFGGGRT